LLRTSGKGLVEISRSRTEPANRVERAGIILAYLDEPSAYGVAQRMGLTRQTVKRCLERAAELGWWRRLTTCAQRVRPGDHRGSPGFACRPMRPPLGYRPGRWVSAELPDYCDLDGV